MKKKTQLFCLLWLFSFSGVWSQDFPSLSEIYDFKSGDEFHFLHFYCYNELSFQLEQWTIEEKYTDNDGLSYIVQKSIFDFINSNPPQLVDTSLLHHSDTLFIAFPDSVLFSAHDEVEVDQDNYNGRMVYIRKYWILDLLKEEKYVKGCGMVYNGWITQQESDCDIIDSLIYYSKGNETWGKTLLRTNKTTKKPPFFFFPNPTRDILHISCLDPSFSIEAIRIIDINGKTQRISPFTSGFNNDHYKLNCSNLRKGIYFIYFSTNKGTLTYKLIKN